MIPACNTLSTLSSIAWAARSSPNEYLHIIATDKIAPMGLTVAEPQRSGAEPDPEYD